MFLGIGNQAETVIKLSVHFLSFQHIQADEGSGGMNEQLNAVVVSRSVPVRLGWPALDDW